MRLPNLKALYVFECAARHLNFRLAADELNVTQGAVAQQVRKLEADLGQCLFERKSRGLELTIKGRQYFAEIRRAIAIIRDATHTLQPDARVVTLSVPPSFATKWLVPRLSVFQEDYPDIDLQIEASENIANFVTDGIDLAVRQTDRPMDASLTAEPLFPFSLVAVASEQYAEGSGSFNTIADFAGHRLLQDGHALWEAEFRKLGIASRGRIQRFNQTALAIDAAVNGNGVALVPSVLVKNELNDGQLQVLWRDAGPATKFFYIVQSTTHQGDKPARDHVWHWLIAQTKIL